MKNIGIYGLGKVFKDYFVDNDFIRNKMKDNEINIIAFFDGNNDKINSEIVYNGKKFYISNKEDWNKFDLDYIVVTSTKYFDEIKKELIDIDIPNEKIHSLNEFIDDWLNEIYHIELFKNMCGVEIGGPSKIFRNIYKVCKSCDDVNFSTNTVWWEKKEDNLYSYSEKVLGKIFIADATDLHCFEDDKYDFVISSNNLEHIANPIKALKESYRILKDKGYLFIIVPNKNKMFDHRRNYTTFKHMLKDYEDDIKEDDLSHLPEIIELHDYDMDKGSKGKENFIKRAEANYENRCLHHHVFSESSLKSLFEYLNLEVIYSIAFINNYLIIGRK